MTILKKENKIDEVRAYVCVCLIVCLFVFVAEIGTRCSRVFMPCIEGFISVASF